MAVESRWMRPGTVIEWWVMPQQIGTDDPPTADSISLRCQTKLARCKAGHGLRNARLENNMNYVFLRKCSNSSFLTWTPSAFHQTRHTLPGPSSQGVLTYPAKNRIMAMDNTSRLISPTHAWNDRCLNQISSSGEVGGCGVYTRLLNVSLAGTVFEIAGAFWLGSTIAALQAAAG